ncbi:MAG: hypothetical protein QM831_06080 [Kofleriaceae bacterium]
MRAALLVVLGCSGAPKGVVTPAGNGLVSTETTPIDGPASFPTQHVDDPALKGKVADLAAEVDGDHNRWTLAVEDNANLRHTYSIELPAKVTFAIATGTNVVIEAESGTISVATDTDLILALGHVPAGWKIDGARVSAPNGDTVELAASPWLKFALAGHTFIGVASPAITLVRSE